MIKKIDILFIGIFFFIFCFFQFTMSTRPPAAPLPPSNEEMVPVAVSDEELRLFLEQQKLQKPPTFKKQDCGTFQSIHQHQHPTDPKPPCQ